MAAPTKALRNIARTTRLEHRARLIYRRNRLAPLVRAAATGALFRSDTPDVSHLAFFEEDGGGALQRDEAILLYGAVRVVRPKTVVEIGFLLGRSAYNFLRAMDPDAHLYSFDVDPASAAVAEELYSHDGRFHFVLKSQEYIDSQDLDGRPIDLLLIDASHDLEVNKRTFMAIRPLLEPRALVFVHDTGGWSKESMTGSPRALAYAADRPDNWLPDGRFAHQPDERKFVNWILSTQDDFSQIHFHSDSRLRHGITVLQAGGPLTVTDIP